MSSGLVVAVTVAGGGRAAVAGASGLGPWLRRVAPVFARGEVSVAIVTDARMRALNSRYRGQDRATDVLSFPISDTWPRASTRRLPADAVLGEIVIAVGVATRQAREEGHGLPTELRVLALHGLLHLLGYDHEVDNGRMGRVEATLRRIGGLPSGLVERARERPRRPDPSQPSGGRR